MVFLVEIGQGITVGHQLPLQLLHEAFHALGTHTHRYRHAQDTASARSSVQLSWVRATLMGHWWSGHAGIKPL
jgi:hypothetical protein